MFALVSTALSLTLGGLGAGLKTVARIADRFKNKRRFK